MTITFVSVSLRDKMSILAWCIRWLFTNQATLMVPNKMVEYVTHLESAKTDGV